MHNGIELCDNSMELGRLLRRIGIYLLILACILGSIDLVSFSKIGDEILGRVFMATGNRYVGSSAIIPVINKVETPSSYTKVVLGDSVCNQVFNGFSEFNKDYLLVGTNAALRFDGQYILARLFIENHPDATDVYIIVLPQVFRHGYNSSTYSYLIEPFGRKGKLEYLPRGTIELLEETYGELFMKNGIINFLDSSCINNKLYLYYLQEHRAIQSNLICDEKYIADDTYVQIKDLLDICDEYGIELHILPSPIIDTKENQMHISCLKKAVEQSELSTLFDEYFDCITLYPAEMSQDGIHFGGENANKETFCECINNLKEKSGCFTDLKMY